MAKLGLKGVLDKRTLPDWFVRFSIALGLSALGYLSVTSSFASLAVRTDPALAHKLAPENGIFTAAFAQEKFLLQPEASSESPASNLARLALLQDPTAVKALTVLGFQARLEGDEIRSDAILTYSTQLSRRELRPQIWAIEEAVNRGDIAGALRHFDIALRVSSDGQELLFPTLASALSEPRIRSELLQVMAKRPIWAGAFVRFVANSGINPQSTARFFLEGEKTSLPLTREVRVDLVNALFGKGYPDEAWAYYTTFSPKADRTRSRDSNFALASAKSAVFEWSIGDEPGLSAAILKAGQAGLVDFSAAASTGGLVVKQTQFLPPGRYQIHGRSRGIEQPDISRPYWLLTCLDGRELGRVTVPNSEQDNGNFSGMVLVPEICALQTLSLIVRASNETLGVTGQIEQLQLEPAS